MKRLLGGLLVTIAAVALLAFLFGGWLLRGSLPQLDGEVTAAVGAPDAAVVIERDAGGATTVRGADMAAVAYGLGFAHAQDRFFQMDLSRRLSSGELSALLGERMLEQDRKARPFRFRRVAKSVVADATPAQRAVLEAYTRGVNRGLESLRVRPWEYILLRATPQPWRPEDSILVVHAMWWQLQYADVGSDMSRRAVVARLEQRATAASRAEADASLAASVTRFLYPRGDDWDAPNLPGSVGGVLVPASSEAPPVPSPEQFDLRAVRSGGAAPPSPS